MEAVEWEGSVKPDASFDVYTQTYHGQVSVEVDVEPDGEWHTLLFTTEFTSNQTVCRGYVDGVLKRVVGVSLPPAD